MKIAIASPHRRYDVVEHFVAHELGMPVLRIRERDALTPAALEAFGPRYVFFPHWSWKIPPAVYDAFECVVFHMTDLPFGRGGSPLQNLIVRGIEETRLSALRCVAELDAGPIYLKRPLSLHGTAEEILMRAAGVMQEMIATIVRDQPQPQPQSGEPVHFKRRGPDDGNIAALTSADAAYDYIRMLDADGYPRAFLETEHLRLDFSRATRRPDGVIADVLIRTK